VDARVITAGLVWVSVLLVGGFFAVPSWTRAVKSVETGNFFGGLMSFALVTRWSLVIELTEKMLTLRGMRVYIRF
jgi:hypothetical protein